MEEKGVSPIVAGVLLLTLFAVASAVIVYRVVPQLQRLNEVNHLREVRDTFLELQSALLTGTDATLELKLSADEIAWIGGEEGPGVLQITSPRWVRRFAPTEDAHVMENKPTQTFNGPDLLVGSENENNVRAFLKFDISGLPADAVISEARVLLFCEDISRFPGTPLDPDENIGLLPIRIEIVPVGNDGWSETTVDWNWAVGAAPDYLNPLGHVNVDLFFAEPQWYSWGPEWPCEADVTGFLIAQREVDNVVSFSMRAKSENSSMSRWARFYSKDSPSENRHFWPYLMVVFESETLGLPPAENLRDEWGVILEGGSVTFEAFSRYFPRQRYVLESGGLILWQWYKTAFISSPGVLLGERPERGMRSENDNMTVFVNRYRVCAVEGMEYLSTKGRCRLLLEVENQAWVERPGANPNRAWVQLIVRTDYHLPWRTLMNDRETWFNSAKGFGFYSGGQWQEVARADWSGTGFYIWGPRTDPNDNDIFYYERVIDVRVSIEVVG